MQYMGDIMEYVNYVSYVLSARRRYDILSELQRGNRTAKELVESTLMSYQYVMLKLTELCEHELVTHNDVKRGRIYSITPLGDEIMRQILNHQGEKNGFKRR